MATQKLFLITYGKCDGIEMFKSGHKKAQLSELAVNLIFLWIKLFYLSNCCLSAASLAIPKSQKFLLQPQNIATSKKFKTNRTATHN